MQETHDAFPTPVQLNPNLNSAVRGPPGIILELLAMLGKNRLLCVELSPLNPAECGRCSPSPRPAAADGGFPERKKYIINKKNNNKTRAERALLIPGSGGAWQSL